MFQQHKELYDQLIKELDLTVSQKIRSNSQVRTITKKLIAKFMDRKQSIYNINPVSSLDSAPKNSNELTIKELSTEELVMNSSLRTERKRSVQVQQNR